MNDDESEPEVNFVKDDEFSQACFQILDKVREEAAKGTINDSIAQVCDDPEKMIDEAKIHALSMMENMGGARPTFVLLSKAGGGLVIPVILANMPDDLQSKLKLMAPLTTVINLAPIDAYFFFSEMWMANYREDQMGASDFKSPSQRDDRKEGVMVFAHRKGETTFRIFEIERDENGKATALHASPISFEGEKFSAKNPLLTNFYDTGDKIAEFMRQSMMDDEGMSGSIN